VGLLSDFSKDRGAGMTLHNAEFFAGVASIHSAFIAMGYQSMAFDKNFGPDRQQSASAPHYH
jgi:hypothetical protein